MTTFPTTTIQREGEMSKNFKRVAFQVIVGGVFAIGAVTAAFSVAVSVKQHAEAALPSEQMAKESNELSSKIAGLQVAETNRASMEEKKAQYESLLFEKSLREAGINPNGELK
jgi:Tfp pilus assembly protein PilN